MSAPLTPSPYLTRGYAPIHMECDYAHVRIEGRIPDDLDGTFYRIGPNPQFPPRGPYSPLDGDGMVHAFRIANGRVSYRNRWVRTQRWQLEHAAGRALFGTTGTAADSDPSVAGRPTDGVANTHLLWHAGRLLALEEGHGPIEIAADTLDTVGAWSYRGDLPGNMTAHPKIDPESRELLFFANFPGRRFDATVAFYVANAQGSIVRSFRLSGPYPGLMHDFAVTKHFVVFFYCPVTVSLKRARSGGPPLAWEPELGTHVALLPRDGGPDQVRWFSTPSCMVWHAMNAFDDGENIYVDVCRQDHPMFPAADGSPPDHRGAAQLLTRWHLDWNNPGGFGAETLHDVPCEYPRIDERRAGLPYRHGYVATLGGPGTDDIFQRGIGHLDLATGRMSLFSAGAHAAVAEPVFVPKPGGSAEGEGWVLTNVFDETHNASHLAIFDAERIEAGPIAEARLEHRVPVGFHGCWIPGTVRTTQAHQAMP